MIAVRNRLPVTIPSGKDFPVGCLDHFLEGQSEIKPGPENTISLSTDAGYGLDGVGWGIKGGGTEWGGDFYSSRVLRFRAGKAIRNFLRGKMNSQAGHSGKRYGLHLPGDMEGRKGNIPGYDREGTIHLRENSKEHDSCDSR
ncbi:hypothetical protein CDAR_59821 [Caerostris darwini]|uniref:Uncharacterized protein n=1 Tax=Caerostris darwini TaxID=1538125 RepID=A0AAV4RSD1_9ARAC|nr:hypothetical protein CDAR_59821 [Caerostris darwini]